MASMSDNADSRLVPRAFAEFATTHWSLVIRAGDRRRPDADAALAWLCERYWYPLYAYVRRHGRDAQDAQDLTQAFFTRLLEKDALAAAPPNGDAFAVFSWRR
jgi:hypothetical protein